MRLNNNGYSFYEVLICLVLVISLINYSVIYLNQINQQLKLSREEYKMKQLLIANLMLLEAKLPLHSNGEDYQFIVNETQICIEWIDLNENKKTYCENFQQ